MTDYRKELEHGLQEVIEMIHSSADKAFLVTKYWQSTKVQLIKWYGKGTKKTLHISQCSFILLLKLDVGMKGLTANFDNLT